MFNDLLNKYERALIKLEEILNKEKSEITRDSAIKRFEIVFDLAWKTLKAYLYEYQKLNVILRKVVFELLIKKA